MSERAKVDVILKKYPNFYLLARLYKEDEEEFLRTHDEDLIIYKFCQNDSIYTSVDELNAGKMKRKVIR